MQRILPVIVVIAALVARPATAQLSDDDVDRAIKKLQTYILNNQQKGGWDHMYQNPHAGKSGVTAMVVYSLVASGVSVQHPQIQEAIKLLRGIEGDHTYEVGLRCHAWGQLPDEYKNEMQKDSNLLRATGSKGVFSYKVSMSPKEYSGDQTPPHDHSNTQYGLLGLWEASKRTVRVDATFWQHVVDHFIRAQATDGGWNYRLNDDRPSYANMSAAGLTALLVAEQELYRSLPKRNPKVGKAIEKGLEWADKNFRPGGSLYGMYGWERVGLASGYKYFNKKDWFLTNATGIVKNQSAAGNVGPIYDSCFALLFLTRGRVPIWCTKLKVSGVEWNNRPNDIYFFTKELSEYIEGEINFQVVDIDDPDHHWFNAPIAWLSSDEKIEFSDEQKARLKRFIDQGGLLVVNGETGSQGGSIFKADMKKMLEEMYSPLKFTRADNNHYLFRVHHKIDAGSGLNITTLNNGARDLVVIPERDWGILLQTSKTDDTQYKAAVNLFVMATERGQLDNRLDVTSLRKKAGTAAGQLRVGRAKYEGNWNPENGVWAVMDINMFNKNNHVIKVEDIDLASLGNSDIPFVHLAGTDPIKLTDAQLAAIKQYIENGGTILVETVGGRRLFASKLEEQLSQLFRSAAAPLSRSSNIVTGDGLKGGFAQRYVTYRRYAIIRLDARHDPRLAAIVHNQRPAVIFSHEDLTLGALGVRLEGLLGYSKDSSVALLGNMVLAATEHKGGADKAPESANVAADPTDPEAKIDFDQNN